MPLPSVVDVYVDVSGVLELVVDHAVDGALD